MAALVSRKNPSNAPKLESDVRRNQGVMTSMKGKAKESTTKPPPGHNIAQAPPVAGSGWDGKEIPWKWASVTSPAASRIPPIFTRDGSYFFSLVGSSVQIHSTATGRVVSTLTAPSNNASSAGRSNAFSCAVLNPHNPFQLITGSLNGCLMIWDFLDGSLLRTIDIAQPIRLICAHEHFKGYVFIAASRPSKNEKQDQNAVVMRVSLQNADAPTNSTSLRSAEVTAVGKTRFPTGLAISPNGVWLVASAGHRVYVAKTSTLAAGFTKYVSPERLTCLAFHPSEEYFATGDDKGVIRLWYCLNDQLAVNVKGVEKKTQTSSLHWHAHAVSTLTFTSNGAYLLSGGEEAVLVIWQLHTGSKEFVPRVGSAINTVSVVRSTSGEEYLLGLSDATYVFVNAGCLRISRSYSRVQIDPGAYIRDLSCSESSPTPLATHSLSSTILLPSSHPSSLQIYSPSTSTLVSILEVSPSNRVSRRDDKPIEHARVEFCALSPSGRWMATVDSRDNDQDFRAEVHLKLWVWDEKSTTWTLNTRIDKPHSSNRIVSLAFNSEGGGDTPLQLVTAGEDGLVKVWRLRSRKLKTGETEEFWVTRATLKHHSEQPHFVSWSPDASLLVVTYESCIVIYETTVYAVLQTLASSECTAPQCAQFLGSRYLLVAGKVQLVLWDILVHSVRWHRSFPTPFEAVVPHPSGASLAVFEQLGSNDSRATRVSILTPQSPKTTKVYTLPFSLSSKVWYSHTAQPSQYSFIGINQNWNLIAFGDSINLAEEDVSAKELRTDLTSKKPSLLQDIFGPSAFVNLTNTPAPSTSQQQIPSSSISAEEILNVPAYLTPAINTFFDSLIYTFLKEPVPREGSSPPDALQMDVDENEELEGDEMQASRTTPSRTVTAAEMGDLVGLFRKHALQGRAPSSHAPKLNDKLANGRHTSMPSHHPPSKLLPNGTSHVIKKPTTTPSHDSTDSDSSSPTLVNGRKRKKP